MTDIDKLIRMNIELEGLLRVLRDRDNPEARDMLSDKIEEYTSALNAFLFTRHDEETEESYHVETISREVQEPIHEIYPAAETVEYESLSQVVEPEPKPEPEPEPIVLHKPEPVVLPEPKTPVNHVSAESAAERNARLNKAFTLNDRFRFRRELFAGDDEDFQETLRLIADMDSYSEACDYLYNDMMWDRNDEVVEEFMAILAANLPQ